jgi:hypothetical protein
MKQTQKRLPETCENAPLSHHTAAVMNYPG